jgi:hypothetical protein
MEYIELGPVPAGEPCAQVGTDNYLARSMRECEVFRRMLERVLPDPGRPAGEVRGPQPPARLRHLPRGLRAVQRR